mmetsp:Transcript_11876/g.17813  ORF Transcript_11876/g.17813 Transcript_11876/m.17813 type:complete len:331 (-) Transcript_11876:163-1155(-)
MVHIQRPSANANRAATSLLTVIKILLLVILLLVLTVIFHILPHSNDQYLTNIAQNKLHLQFPTSQTPGWKSIDVFYGDHKHLQTAGRGSQCNQDLLVSSLLPHVKNGYFLDLAANDAVNLSNTYKLEQLHEWTGICVEPNSMYWSNLAHRKCHVAAAVVSKMRMQEVNFRMYRDMWRRAASGGIEELIDPKIPKSKEPPAKLYTVPIQEILERYHAPYVMEYLSLDIEGAEYMVMKDFPFGDYKFKVMTVERPSQDLTDLLFENGYLYLAGNNVDGQETAWIHGEFRGEIDIVGGVEKAGWIGGKSTKWMTLVDENDRWGKPVVDDLRLK